MRLHSREFEKKLRRGVRQELKRSRELRQEFRKSRKVRRKYQLMVVVRPLVSVAFGAGAWAMLDKTGHLASALALINLWAFAFVFIHAQRLLSCLYHSRDLPCLVLLPVTEDLIFRWQIQKCLRGTLWSFLDFLCAYVAVALPGHFSLGQWCIVPPMAAVTWLQTLALAALGVAYAPRLPYHLATSILSVILFVLYVTRPLIGDALLTLIDAAAPGLNALLPTGWSVSFFQGFVPGTPAVLFCFGAPLALTLLSIKHSLARLAANYQYREPVQRELPDLPPEGAGASPNLAAETDPAKPLRVGPTAIEEIVLTRQFLAAPTWPRQGRIERLLWERLKPREQALTEFVFPYGRGLGLSWQKIFRNFALACVLGLAAGIISPTARDWILGAGLFVTVCQALGQLLANGRAFQLIHCSGVQIPLYAGFGIGFRELSSVLFKWSLVQLPCLLAFATACGVLVTYLIHGSLPAGALMGFKAGGLLLASRFLFLVFAFSPGTNDTTGPRFRSFYLICLVLFFALAFVGCALASLFLPNQPLAWLLWLLAALDSYLFFRIYAWFYDRGRFDLMSIPRN